MTLSFEFAFEGFRIIRQKPKLILFWGLLSLIGNGAISLLMVSMAGPAFMSFYQMVGQSSGLAPDPARVYGLSSQILPAMLASLPIYLVTSALLTGAVCRAAGGERDDRFGFLAFGPREWLLIALEVVMLAIRLGVMLGCLVVGGLLAQVFSTSGSDAVSACLTLAMTAAVGIVIWLSVRLSLNAAQTFDEGRLNVLGSLPLTKGLAWPLFAGYAVATGLAFVVMFLCNRVIEAVLVLGFGAASGNAVDMPNMSSLASFLTPANIADLVLTNGVMSPLTAAILIGAPVAAYRTMRLRRKPAAA